eukprot:TRINITY_DN17465_c0_g1_i2.p1 TRINITY_DN17465_c0_g1~~TRINITY_DN17465_c0_g1_i2.p1  ORF type:complete len:231 (-),score=16.60 TRINITY_DN17465_c0_g1_i2:24-716(-)
MTPTERSTDNHRRSKAHVQVEAADLDGHGIFFSRVVTAVGKTSPSGQARELHLLAGHTPDGSRSNLTQGLKVASSSSRAAKEALAPNDHSLDGWARLCENLDSNLGVNSLWTSRRHPLLLALSCTPSDYTLRLWASSASIHDAAAGKAAPVAEFQPTGFRTWSRYQKEFFALDLNQTVHTGFPGASAWPFPQGSSSFYLRGSSRQDDEPHAEIGLVAGSNTQAVSFVSKL